MSDYIIEVSNAPLKPEERMVEDLFYDDFVGWIAEYVDDNVLDYVRKDVIESFAQGLSNAFPEYVSYSPENESFTFKEGFNEAFAKRQIKSIKDVVQNTSEDSSLFELSWRLHELIGDPFGTYIFKDALYKEITFLRDVHPGTYYFGGVVYYK